MDRAELYYNMACSRKKEQDNQRWHFDAMATAILGFSGVLVAIMSFPTSEWAWWSVYPAIGVLVSFGGVAIFTIFALRLRKWEFQPPLTDLYNHMASLEYEDEALVIWTAKWMSDAISNNKTPLRHKALCLNYSYISLVLEVLTLGVFIFSVAS